MFSLHVMFACVRPLVHWICGKVWRNLVTICWICQ